MIRDVTYDTEPVLDPSPNSTAQRTYYAKTSTRSTPYNTQIVEVDTTDLPAELKNAPISSDLLPGPGTKVTTTVGGLFIERWWDLEHGSSKLTAWCILSAKFSAHIETRYQQNITKILIKNSKAKFSDWKDHILTIRNFLDIDDHGLPILVSKLLQLRNLIFFTFLNKHKCHESLEMPICVLLLIVTKSLRTIFPQKQIKTFTYEIPDDTKVPTNQNFSYKNEYYNESNSSRTFYPERDVPPPITTTTSYSNESHNNTLNRINGPSVPMNPENLGPNQTYFYKKEVNETKNNVRIRLEVPVIWYIMGRFELIRGIFHYWIDLWSTTICAAFNKRNIDLWAQRYRHTECHSTTTCTASNKWNIDLWTQRYRHTECYSSTGWYSGFASTGSARR